jgi:hypothetical protein
MEQKSHNSTLGNSCRPNNKSAKQGLHLVCKNKGKNEVIGILLTNCDNLVKNEQKENNSLTHFPFAVRSHHCQVFNRE